MKCCLAYGMLPFHMNNKPRLKSNKIAGLAEATVEQLDISIAANWFLSQMSAISPCPAATHEGECSNSESADTKPAKARRSKGKRRRISSKRDIRRAEPLSVGLRSRQTAADSTQEAAWLSQCQALYKRLPKQSRYAKHRLKVLSKAMAILRRRRAERSGAEAEELQELLCSLKIVSTEAGTEAAAHTDNNAGAGTADSMQD